MSEWGNASMPSTTAVDPIDPLTHIPTSGTFSIVAVDLDAGEAGVGVASALKRLFDERRG